MLSRVQQRWGCSTTKYKSRNSKCDLRGGVFAADGVISVSKKEWLIIAGSAVVVFLLTIWAFAGTKRQPKEAAKAWSRDGIKASFMAAQLREVDKTHAGLILSYDLQNLTDSDYRLSDGAGVAIMSRLKSDGSLSQEEPMRLSYPVFLPAGQRAHLAIEITQNFAWPREDSHHEEKLKEFVRQRLAGVGGFVLFDEPDHIQIDLPAAWAELQGQDGTKTGG